MPEFPIVDTHVHLTNLNRIRYTNLQDEAPTLHKSVDLATFQNHAQSIDIDSFLFMEIVCDFDNRSDEAQWATELAREDPRLKGIIACALMENGSEVTVELEAYKQNPLIKGVRRLLQTEAIDFCVQPSFLEGLRCLPAFDYSFDICVYHQHLSHVVEMVRACPNVHFILDHIGKPKIKDQLFEPWKADIRSLAELSNVHCKISGMVTEADHDIWNRDDLRPYFDHVIECFSFDRVIFGGDWFISTLATTYAEWVATVDWAFSGCSTSELKKLYCDNARDFYGLNSPDNKDLQSSTL